MDRRLTCDICGDGFQRPRALRRHLEFRHHQKPAATGSATAFPYSRQNDQRQTANPAANLRSPNATDHSSRRSNEDLPTPPTCTIDIPAADDSPSSGVITTTHSPVIKDQTVAPPPAPIDRFSTQTSSQATQTDSTVSTPSQATRRLFTPDRKQNLIVFRTPPIPSVSIASRAQQQYLHHTS